MGGPEFFSGTGPITYDDLSIGGFRTCSITQASGIAQDFYQPLIEVKGRMIVTYGWNIRAVDADQILYVADFYDADKEFKSSKEKNVTQKISYNFKAVNTQFLIPSGADYMKLSVKFVGKITACTFWAPNAEFF